MAFYIYKYVYRDEIIYVGKTKRPLIERVGEHANEQKFFRYLNEAKIYYFTVSTAVEMDIYEKYLINVHSPILNVVDMDHAKFKFTLPVPVWNLYDAASYRQAISISNNLVNNPSNDPRTQKRIQLEDQLTNLHHKEAELENLEGLLEMLWEQKLSIGLDERDGYVYYEWDMEMDPLPDTIVIHGDEYPCFISSRQVTAHKWENKVPVKIMGILLQQGLSAVKEEYRKVRAEVLDKEYTLENL